MSRDSSGTQGKPDLGRKLRVQMLTTPPTKFGIEPTAAYPRVYGVLMDWPIGADTATVVSFCDGSASLYTTSTFGVLGGIGHESVRKRAQAFVREAAHYVDDGRPTSSFPYPEPHLVRFYLLTFGGVRVIDADLQAITSREHPYATLFDCGQAVLTELRLASKRVPAGEGASSTLRKKPSGMSEYVNCLLTAMSEGVLHLAEIAASEPVPNLVDLTAGHKDLREWIEAKQFPFQSLDAKKVIRALRQSAEISGPPFSTKRGDMLTVHPQDDGSRVARVFDIQVGPFNRWARVELAAEDDPRVIALQRQIDAQNAG